jgi:hypothetical protein
LARSHTSNLETFLSVLNAKEKLSSLNVQTAMMVVSIK